MEGNINAKPGQLVKISGANSSDADGNLLSYKWSLIFLPTGSKATLSPINTPDTSITPDIGGLYKIQLIVNDGKGDSAPVTIELIVSTQNSAPIANAGQDQNVITGTIATLDGSASSDPDSDALTYHWTFVSVPNGSMANLNNIDKKKSTFTPDKDGKYIIRLLVNDGEIESMPDEVMITATKLNSAPIANAGDDRGIRTGDTIKLSGEQSSDADGDLLTYKWYFVSNPSNSNASIINATSAIPSFTPDVSGSYVIALVVNDGKVESTPDNVVIIALNSPPAPTGLFALNLYGWVSLEWNKIYDPNIKGYNIYVDGILMAYTSNTSYRHNGTVGVTYNYYVKAVDSVGEGNQSLTVQGTPAGPVIDITAPDIPTGLTATSTHVNMPNGVSSITATWNANSETDLAYYVVRIKEETGGNYIEFNAPTNSYTWTSGVKAGITYYINVKAVDASGNASGWVASDYMIVAAPD